MTELKLLDSLDKELQYYYLGFNLQNFIPSDEQYEARLKEFKELGIENFCKAREKEIEEEFSQYTLSNTENVLYMKYSLYPRTDIVHYQSGLHTYIFTRSEFKHLLEKRENLYTRQQLPLPLLGLCMGLTEMNLPESETLERLLTKALTPIRSLFPSSSVRQTVLENLRRSRQENIDRPNPVNPQIFSLNFMSFMFGSNPPT